MCANCCSASARRHVHVGRPRLASTSADAVPAAAAADLLVARPSDARRPSLRRQPRRRRVGGHCRPVCLTVRTLGFRSSFRDADDGGLVVVHEHVNVTSSVRAHHRLRRDSRRAYKSVKNDCSSKFNKLSIAADKAKRRISDWRLDAVWAEMAGRRSEYKEGMET